jgi:TonB family protein
MLAHGIGLARMDGARSLSVRRAILLVRKLKYLICLGLLTIVTGLSLGTSPAFATDEGTRKVRSRVTPLYPELARKMNVTGTVKVQVVIAANGVVKSTKLVGGHPLLVEPSLEAAKKWKYEPANEETTETVEFKFTGND